MQATKDGCGARQSAYLTGLFVRDAKISADGMAPDSIKNGSGSCLGNASSPVRPSINFSFRVVGSVRRYSDAVRRRSMRRILCTLRHSY
jgi:hypothetical protein